MCLTAIARSKCITSKKLSPRIVMIAQQHHNSVDGVTVPRKCRQAGDDGATVPRKRHNRRL